MRMRPLQGSFSLLLSALHELHVQRNGHLFAHQDSARFQRRIPRQPEVLAVDLRGRREADANVAPRILGRWRRTFGLEDDFASHAVNRQLAGEGQVAILHALHPCRAEVQRRELFYIEEVCALQVRVALGISRVDRGCVNRSRHPRIGEIAFVQIQYARDAGELSLYVRNHHVSHLELGDRMNRVEVPGGSGGLRWCSRCAHQFLSFQL